MNESNSTKKKATKFSSDLGLVLVQALIKCWSSNGSESC